MTFHSDNEADRGDLNVTERAGAQRYGAIDADHNPLKLIDVTTPKGLAMAMRLADYLCDPGAAVPKRPWSSKAWTLIVAHTLHALATAPSASAIRLNDIAARLVLGPDAAERLYEDMLAADLTVCEEVSTFIVVAARQMLVRKVFERQDCQREALRYLAFWAPSSGAGGR